MVGSFVTEISGMENMGTVGGNDSRWYNTSYPDYNVKNLSNVLSISSDTTHTCAIDSSKKVWCWGRNNYGQQGDGSSGDNNVPVEVIGISNAVEIDLGTILVAHV